MIHLGTGSVLDALLRAATRSRRYHGVTWICPSCRNSSLGQRRRAHSGLQSSLGAREDVSNDASLSDITRRAQRRSRSDADDSQADKPSTSAYPFRVFLARHQQEPRQRQSTSNEQRTSCSPEYEDTLAALRQEDATALIAKLALAAETNGASLRQIPHTTWTEIIHTLDPGRNLVAPIHSAHRALTGRKNAAARAIFQHTRSSFMQLLSQFSHICHRIGVPLQTQHYRLLLKYAASMGSNNMARYLWKEMEEAGVAPDLDCFNYRMEALLFNEGSRLLQTKAARGVRSKELGSAEAPVFSRITLFKPGDSSRVQSLLHELEMQGIKADTRVYCNLITALARDGDLDGVIRILSSVWRLDVRAIMQGQTVSHVSDLTSSDPLYPNSRLLVAIADAFGSHNSLGIAIRLTDMISQHYDLPVKSNVWFRLLQWTALYARRNNDEARKSGRKNNNSSRSTRRAQANLFLGDLDLLIQTMTMPPYNVNVTLDMLHLMQKNVLGQSALGSSAFTAPADVGREKYAEAIAKYREQLHQLRTDSALVSGQIIPPKRAVRLERRIRVLEMNKAVGHNYLTWWAHLIVQHAIPASTELSEEEAEGITNWQVRGLPDFIMNNRAFVPSSFQYQTPGGMVQLVFRTGEDIEEIQRRKQAAGKRRRMTLINLKTVKRPWDSGLGSWTGRSKGIRRQAAGRARLANPFSTP